MTNQLRDIAEASRDIERSKMELQMKLFSEQMEYQRHRDQRLHDHARNIDDNAKLAILKQSEVVHCLSELTAEFTTGVHRSKAAATYAANTLQEERSLGTHDHHMPSSSGDATNPMQQGAASGH